MANNYLITGYWGEPHVTAENDRGLNAGIFGPGRLVLPVGQQLRAEYIGNNTVRLYDGKLLDNGALGGIPAGKYVDLLIPEAGQGMKRNDIIVFQYSKDASTLVETGVFAVVSGKEVSGTAADPALVQQDLLTDEATFDQMPLYRVAVDGATINAPEAVFELSLNFAAVTSVAPNLLDNSNWAKPVNQRGDSSYRGLKYSIDRWIVPSDTAALSLGEGFVLLQNDATSGTAMFTQRLEKGVLKTGKAYTAVICLSDDTILCGSGTMASGGATLTDNTKSVYATIAPSSAYDVFRLVVAPAKQARIKWVALYEGEYSSDNLPVYQPKGYGAELLECSRYYVPVGGYVTVNHNSGYGGTAEVSCPLTMRTTPTVELTNTGLQIYDGTSGWKDCSIGSVVQRSTAMYSVVFTPAGYTYMTGLSYLGRGIAALSADL